MLGLLLLLSSLTQSSDPITIDKHAPTTQVVSFDPAHPPEDVAKLRHGEDAITRMLFNCTVNLKYRDINHYKQDGQWHVLAKLGEVKVTVELTNTIFLPDYASSGLRAHELGHAKINAIVYEDAERAARQAAEDMMDKQWEGKGADIDAAGKAATDAAVNAICHEYLSETADRAYRIGEIYDRITRHGTNYKKEDDAIREAIQKQKEEREGLAK